MAPKLHCIKSTIILHPRHVVKFVGDFFVHLGMANYETSLKITGLNEGGWNNTPGDHGGETYSGIARKYWPNWAGWVVIDVYKKQHGTKDISKNMANSPAMQELVKHFYKQNFWDALKLDLINDQQVANNLYDMAVNSGTITAAKMLQKAVEVVADGIVGAKTISATNASNGRDVFNSLNIIRREFYTHLATHPDQHQFLHSWLSRLVDYK